MELGLVGLGRMGNNIVQRLLRDGHQVVTYDTKQEAVQTIARQGAIGATSLKQLVQKLRQPRAVWVMVPAGVPTESTVKSLADEMSPGDVIIDGG